MSKRRRSHVGPNEARSGAYEQLMHEVCVGMGYCGSIVDGEPRHVDDYIPESGPVSAQQFVEWVFLAEGIDPCGSSHAGEMRKIFVTHMGAEAVDASRLKWHFERSQSSSSS